MAGTTTRLSGTGRAAYRLRGDVLLVALYCAHSRYRDIPSNRPHTSRTEDPSMDEYRPYPTDQPNDEDNSDEESEAQPAATAPQSRVPSMGSAQARDDDEDDDEDEGDEEDE